MDQIGATMSRNKTEMLHFISTDEKFCSKYTLYVILTPYTEGGIRGMNSERKNSNLSL